MDNFIKGVRQKAENRVGFICVCSLLILYLAVVSIFFPGYLDWINVFSTSASIGILASAVTFVMLTGRVDLSCGALLSLTGCISCSLIDKSQVLAAVIPLLVGILCGFFNGILMGVLKINSYLATLGLMAVYQSMAFSYTKGNYFSSSGENWYQALSTGRVAGIPAPVVVFLAVVAVCAFVQKRTVFGARLYAVGDNSSSARFTGISPEWVVIKAYMIVGVGAAVSGFLLCSRSMASQPKMGQGYEFDAFTAVIIGGLSLKGGAGGAWGTLLGVVLLGVLKSSFVALGIGTAGQYMAQGLVIFAVLVAQSLERGRDGL